ncbi:MAG: hypothetical protein HC821_01420 [Lewinella sp.]|nr:hypothetical protein [Lewinella sp.]
MVFYLHPTPKRRLSYRHHYHYRLQLLPLLAVAYILVWSSTPLYGQAQIEQKAAKGEGIISLLRRYQLENHECNFREFYRLNDLKKGDGLQVGRSYQLPVQSYSYNGKSIRSTTGVADFDWALSVQNYNEALLAAKLKAQDFRQDLVLYVPFTWPIAPMN